MKKVRANLHTHTLYSDGANRAEDYVLAAIEKGFHSIGFSDHAYNSYDVLCRIGRERTGDYLKEIDALRSKYKGRIDVYAGIENDYFEPMDPALFQFVIGSTHFVRGGDGEYYSIESSPELFLAAAQSLGGIPQLVKRYFGQVADLALHQKPDIIGHMDLISKLNERHRFYDPESQWYRQALDQAVDAVVQSGCVVEMNSGGMFRKYTTQPYPCGYILKQLHRANVPVTISSDAHCVQALDFYFDEMLGLLMSAGYRSYWEYRQGAFQEISLTAYSVSL